MTVRSHRFLSLHMGTRGRHQNNECSECLSFGSPEEGVKSVGVGVTGNGELPCMDDGN